MRRPEAMSSPNCSARGLAGDVCLGTFLLLECALSALGNSVALGTLCLRLRVWKPYAVFLLHLALADLLLTACLPFRAAFYLRRRGWPRGPSACRALAFLRVLGRGAGVAFLTAVALDRYLRVVHPRLRVNQLSPRGAQAASGLVWLLLAALNGPALWAPESECPRLAPGGAPRFGRQWQEAVSALQCLVPLGLILFCHAGLLRALRARLRDAGGQPRLRRARALLAAAVLLFALCFLPSLLARAVAAAAPPGCGPGLALDLTDGLTYLQSVLNPVVYCFSSPAFKTSYRRVLRTLRGRRADPAPPRGHPRRSDSSGPSAGT